MSEDTGKEVRPWQSYHTVYTNAKAGMEGIDKERVQRIVYESSKGSKYFENEERKEAFMKQKTENMRAQCEKLTEMEISHYEMVANKRILELEAARDLSKIWLHVDMDAFYAAVETLENPSLKGKPMAVGGMSMICTANYEARRFGVRAAMPGFIARKLCSDLILVPTNFKKYTYYSDLTRKVFQKYDANFIASSLDEAYLDITEVCKERGKSSGEISEELRTCIYEETGLTCSAGVAPNRLLAKVCSDINKPNGQFILANDRMAVMTFISSLPIRKIGGIGKVTEHILRDVFGINTCEELLQKSAFLFALFSRSSAVGLGIGKTDAPQVGLRKSISCERTFSATEDEALLYQKLADIADALSSDMRKEGLHGRTLTLKLKTASFEVRTRALSLQKYIISSEDILSHASKLLKAELPLSLRLIGLRMSHFNEEILGYADPTQKKLTNFVIPVNVSALVSCGNSSLCSENNDIHSILDTEINSDKSCLSDKRTSTQPCLKDLGSAKTCFSDTVHEYYSGNSSDLNQLSHLEHKHHILGYDACEMEKTQEIMDTECLAKVASSNSTGYTTQSHEADGLQMLEMGSVSYSGLPETNYVEGQNVQTKFLDDKVVLSTNQKELVLWVDDYMCSLCGFELPSCFVEERQEHTDYHLAEMLQKQESEQNSGSLMQTKRPSQKAQNDRECRRKKQKTSPNASKYIPIDTFFVKSNQNF